MSESSERTYSKEYSEAIAQIKEQHQQELERLQQELRIGLQSFEFFTNNDYRVKDKKTGKSDVCINSSA